MNITPKRPFSISPNPNALYLTPALDAVLFRVRYTCDQRQGATVILGDNGLGKSTLIRYLHAEYDAREDTISLLLATPSFTSEYAMLTALCHLVHIPARRSVQAQQQALEIWLTEQFRATRNVVLWIDEAQKLTNKMLEVIRALLNFETNTEKLIQVVLAGQLELRERLATKPMRALASRIVVPSLLSPLTEPEVGGLLTARCAYWKLANPFPPETVRRFYELTGGVPRAVLVLAGVSYEMMTLARADYVSPKLATMAADEASLLQLDRRV